MQFVKDQPSKMSRLRPQRVEPFIIQLRASVACSIAALSLAFPQREDEPDREGGLAKASSQLPASLKRLFRKSREAMGDPLRLPRGATASVLLLYGLALIAASVALGVASVTAEFTPASGAGPIHKEVGFLYAPNWPLTAIVVWPAMFYALRTMLDEADRLFGEIDSSPMAWLAAHESSQSTIASTWSRRKRLLRRLVLLIIIFGIAVSVAEWWGVSGRVLLGKGTAILEHEDDWSIALREGSLWDRRFLAAFTLATYLYQAVTFAMITTFGAVTLLIARTIGLHGAGVEKPPLLVDIGSNDPGRRVGFERFVIVIDYMILFVALAFTNFFLTRIQNAYLRSSNTSIFEFLQQDIGVKNIDDIGKLFAPDYLDFSSAVVSVSGVNILFLTFFFFNATLRHSAIMARNRSDRALMDDRLQPQLEYYGLTKESVCERLRAANVWPLGYSDLLPTLSFLVICLLTIIFYRMGVYLVFLWVAGWIVARGASGLIRSR